MVTTPASDSSLPGGNRLIETFVELADTLVDDFDTIAFLQVLVDRCVELLEVDAAGLQLSDHHGRLRLIASSSEQVRLLELLQLQNDEGPCLDAFRSGTRVSHPRLSTAGTTWPTFAEAAGKAGFAAVDAMPMKLRSDVIGALTLFRTASGALPPGDLRTARALVDIATIGLLQERSIRRRDVVTEQLQLALTSRVLVEQAKGVLSVRLGVDMDSAFAALRGYARSHHLKLADLARTILDDRAWTHELFTERRRPSQENSGPTAPLGAARPNDLDPS
ncbi:GAF and ANTAR domain-containing protein [Amycolatopsis kentuckyensis]|uniref:GAF and ANTAR domain-containing protein n=1 Tax=Amycolatopsis kentuckyensis TaxID=218823 RepID=UPI001FC9E085|nr:GAF and ANTAR domain-containing protein [Amycolatopsis kentuckyensis]